MNIRYFGTGKSKLLAGTPLRVLVLTETPETPTANKASSTVVDYSISLRKDKESWVEKLKHLGPVTAEPGVVVTAYGVEFDTTRLTPGAYELELLSSEGSVYYSEENIWVLNDVQYYQLWDE